MGNRRQSAPGRGPGKTLLLCDIENLAGCGAPTSDDVAAVAESVYAALRVPAESLHTVLACNTLNAGVVLFKWPHPARRMIGRGRDAADHRLIEAMTETGVRYDTVVIASGDGALADEAERLRQQGRTRVVVVYGRGTPSRRLLGAADEVIRLPLGPQKPEAAFCHLEHLAGRSALSESDMSDVVSGMAAAFGRALPTVFAVSGERNYRVAAAAIPAPADGPGPTSTARRGRRREYLLAAGPGAGAGRLLAQSMRARAAERGGALSGKTFVVGAEGTFCAPEARRIKSQGGRIVVAVGRNRPIDALTSAADSTVHIPMPR